jgi:hypothetical protein
MLIIAGRFGVVVAGASGLMDSVAVRVCVPKEALTMASSIAVGMIGCAIPVAVKVPITSPSAITSELGSIFKTSVLSQNSSMVTPPPAAGPSSVMVP